MNMKLYKFLRRIVVRGHDLVCWHNQYRLARFERRFKRDHPNYCRTCQGWSYFSVPDSRYEPGFADPCPDCACEGRCPHCAAETLNDDNEFAECSACGWIIDKSDGLHDPGDCGCWYIHDTGPKSDVEGIF